MSNPPIGECSGPQQTSEQCQLVVRSVLALGLREAVQTAPFCEGFGHEAKLVLKNPGELALAHPGKTAAMLAARRLELPAVALAADGATNYYSPEQALCDPAKGIKDPEVQRRVLAWLEDTST